MITGYIKVLGGVLGSALLGDAVAHASAPLGGATAIELGVAATVGMVIVTTTTWLVGGRQKLMDGQAFLSEKIDKINERLDKLACNSPQVFCRMVKKAQEEINQENGHKK